MFSPLHIFDFMWVSVSNRISCNHRLINNTDRTKDFVFSIISIIKIIKKIGNNFITAFKQILPLKFDL